MISGNGGVTNALTSLGRALLEAIQPLMEWSIAHTDDIGASRATYDTRLPVPLD